jgi:hypothetical protein
VLQKSSEILQHRFERCIRIGGCEIVIVIHFRASESHGYKFIGGAVLRDSVRALRKCGLNSEVFALPNSQRKRPLVSVLWNTSKRTGHDSSPNWRSSSTIFYSLVNRTLDRRMSYLHVASVLGLRKVVGQYSLIFLSLVNPDKSASRQLASGQFALSENPIRQALARYCVGNTKRSNGNDAGPSARRRGGQCRGGAERKVRAPPSRLPPRLPWRTWAVPKATLHSD